MKLLRKNSVSLLVLTCGTSFLMMDSAVSQSQNSSVSSSPNSKPTHTLVVSESEKIPSLAPSGQFDLPEIITWSIPNGTIEHHHVLEGTIRPVLGTSAGVWCESSPVNCCSLECNCYQRSPQSVVNKLTNLYATNSDLYGESPAIFLQELGMGNGDPCPLPGTVQHWMYADALFLNWCDQIKPDVNDPCSPPSHDSARWLSPWNDNGVLLLKNWMTSFLDKYQIRVNNGTLPVPARFVFDTEYWPMAPFWGDRAITAFRDLAGLNSGEVPDSRWDTKLLPVYNKTLKELYDEGIANGMTPPIPGNWSIEENQSWVIWYDGIMSTMCDAAMKEALFDPIKEVWPEAICSNFDTSISADGLQSIAGSPLRVFRNRRHQSASWFVLVQKGSSDEQAAELYPVSEFHLQPNEDPGLAWSRVHRANIEACIESYDGYTADEIMPWIPLIDTPFITGWNGEIERPDKWSVRNLIAMFRSKGIKKFFIWSVNSSENTQNWSEFDDLIDQVWLSELSGYTVNVGSSETGAISKILISDWNWKEEHVDDVLSIVSSNSESSYDVEFELEFDTGYNCSQTREMQLLVDARLEGDLVLLDSEALLHFSLENATTGEWVPIEDSVVDLMSFDSTQDKWIWDEVSEPSAIPIDQRRVIIHLPIKLSRYWINESGEVKIRLYGNSSEPFTLLLDSATLFETDNLQFEEDCLADCAPEGGDGVVDVLDLLLVISEYNVDGGIADIDPLCGDGEVKVHDILKVISSWGDVCVQ